MSAACATSEADKKAMAAQGSAKVDQNTQFLALSPGFDDLGAMHVGKAWLEAALHIAFTRWLVVKHGLMWVSRHTGIPAVVLAAIAIVLGWRLWRRSARFALEVGVVLAVLLLLSKIGLLKF
jgi:hypothetical protein